MTIANDWMGFREEEGPVRRLSRHFRERWIERMGAATTVENLNRMCRAGVRIRYQQDLLKPVRSGLKKPYVILAEYWLCDQSAIIFVDERNGVAVTLITPKSSQDKYSYEREGRGRRGHQYRRPEALQIK